jgi:hypothetical protein
LKLGMPTRISASPISSSLCFTSSLKTSPSIAHLSKSETSYIYQDLPVKQNKIPFSFIVLFDRIEDLRIDVRDAVGNAVP